MKSHFKHMAFFAAVILCTFSLALEAAPITVSVNLSEPGAEISPRMPGLSYETSLMLPATNGTHYFRRSNRPLVNIFKTLGIQSLRIGGNSVDAPAIQVPDETDIAKFFQFANAAGVKVIYSVRLEETTNSSGSSAASAAANIESAARIAKFIHNHYADTLDCFAIGNEPGYFKDYAVYGAKWKAIRDAILAVYPEARFCGPDQNPSPELDAKMVRDFGSPTGRLAEITQHSYPFGCAYRNPKDKADITKLVPFDAAQSRDKMLSPSAYKTYEKICDGITNAIAGSPVAYRLSEVNSYWFSGLKGASDSYASALWAVDYLHWWASHGADGLNFHNGDRTGGDLSMPCRYAAFVSSGRGYEARPLAYGLKLFNLGGSGKELPVTVSNSPEQNLAVYATLDKDKTVAVTVINKAHGLEAKEETVQIDLGSAAIKKAKAIYLRGKNDDISGSSGDVTLGDASIKENGDWNGRWKDLPPDAIRNNVVTLTMSPASAVVVKINLR